VGVVDCGSGGLRSRAGSWGGWECEEGCASGGLGELGGWASGASVGVGAVGVVDWGVGG
jgi:hypothetical protein